MCLVSALPTEIWCKILGYVTNVRDLHHFSLTCRRAHEHVSGHSHWRPFSTAYAALTRVVPDDASGRSVVFEREDLELRLVDGEGQMNKLTAMICGAARANVDAAEDVAKLCKLWDSERLVNVAKSSADYPRKHFRRQLMKRCKRDYRLFEISKHLVGKKELYEHYANLVFIAALYKQRFCSSDLVHAILTSLLSSTEEDRWCCACRILVLAGHALDSERTASRVKMDGYFRILKLTLRTRTRFSSRLTFMIKEVVDRRKNGWDSRAERYFQAVECPKRKVLWKSAGNFTLL